ncbi:MAG: sigma-54-dependent Fis family transcriptional regulator [Thiotrichaceae bacterium]|nr:sigma-54-dependent Fis family transcriptional regulator [Thiotrichaceae bacterium]
MNQNPVYIIDDDFQVRKSFKQTLELGGFQVKAFESAQQCLQLGNITTFFQSVIISDIKMPDMSGLELLDAVKLIDQDIPVILITGHADINMAIDGMKRGAYDFIEKPVKPEHAIDVVKKAQRQRSLIIENRELKIQLGKQQICNTTIIGSHPLTQKLIEQISNLSTTNVDVLIHGETGAGKEIVAQELHQQSPRKNNNFVALNCGAIPEELIESELFGHEQGAFTSASKKRIGKIEYANHGTLFLDEIESMPLNVQIKLLRVLQERVIERLGSNETINLDFTVIAATKTDLKQASEEGLFRADLYYRLDVAVINISPLRARGDDILLLFNFFCEQAATRYNREYMPISYQQQQKLKTYDWPGNVRECRNLAEKWILGLKDHTIFTTTHDTGEYTTLEYQVDSHEKKVVLQALELNQWKISQTAEYLNIPRKKLYLRMKKYELDKNTQP